MKNTMKIDTKEIVRLNAKVEAQDMTTTMLGTEIKNLSQVIKLDLQKLELLLTQSTSKPFISINTMDSIEKEMIILGAYFEQYRAVHSAIVTSTSLDNMPSTLGGLEEHDIESFYHGTPIQD